MSALHNTIETVLETEEYISAEEYLRRRERGEIDPGNVRFTTSPPNPDDLGCFVVKLKTPRYRVDFPQSRQGNGL